MTMKTISRQTYEDLGGIHQMISLGLTTERLWYRYDNLLGIVLLDNVDHDWSFVALAHDPRNTFRCFDMGASFRTPEEAEAALAKAFAIGPQADFFTEAV